ncbi:diaminobutyrate acetyltransferase [Hydrogenovibrio sp. SC-1]|uniref:diaminobutyrate acetyltransferase n=1 Tax=Hydrogenovibrio sp. SC-1 TaxID=2065820 RepID=UPI000C7DBAC7|nr:diaminobutyrate acetyltransferase [Hydrogenovibrio sp. SC-1]PLA75445.1 diaminobutyrate acetyltransferase [Hydrogenovibrio sp. SC-1]
MTQNNLVFRSPTLEDGLAIYELVKASPPLDVNSSYLYFLQASHFADTCIVVEQNREIVGFLSGYYRPDDSHSLFVWQVAVSETMRGQGLAKRMIQALIANQRGRVKVSSICCTISPSNQASQALFKSFAKQYDLKMTVTEFITEAHFGAEGHEAEELYLLSSPNKADIALL